MTNVFAYLRVSGKGQLEGDGFTRQLHAIRQYAASNNLRIARVFREEGVSGTKDLENRPALQELMLALDKHGTKTMIVEKLDRVARDLMVQETIIGDLRKRGFELISVAEPDLCSDDPSRKLVRQVFGAIAEYERAMIVLKLRGARQRVKAETGKCEGRKRYGSRDGEAAIIDQMRQLRQNGMAVDKIASVLNTKGIRPRSGQQWYGSSVSNILKAAQAF